MENRAKKTDRRSMRSKKAILDAFAEMVVEKESRHISVTDVIERANIGRTTFYAHFEDMPDLQSFIFNRLLQQIEQEVNQSVIDMGAAPDSSQALIPSLALFKIAAKKHDIFKANAENPDTGLRHLIPSLVERLEKQLDEIDAPKASGDISRRTMSIYLLNGLIALLIDWVLADMPESPEIMNRKFQLLAEPTLKRLLGS
jgi:AcrR family transcriptional regulator